MNQSVLLYSLLLFLFSLLTILSIPFFSLLILINNLIVLIHLNLSSLSSLFVLSSFPSFQSESIVTLLSLFISIESSRPLDRPVGSLPLYYLLFDFSFSFCSPTPNPPPSPLFLPPLFSHLSIPLSSYGWNTACIISPFPHSLPPPISLSSPLSIAAIYMYCHG